MDKLQELLKKIENETNPMKIIRAKCLECSNFSTYEIEKCPCTNCVLWKWRSGKNPNRKRSEMSEERKKVLGDHLRELRNKT